MRSIVTAIAAALAMSTFACSAMMDDLSDGEGEGKPGATGSNGGRGGDTGDDAMLNPQVGSTTNSSALQSNPGGGSDAGADTGPVLTPAPTPGPTKSPFCDLATLRPTSAFNSGTGQTWRSPELAMGADGATSFSPLSTDNRESMYLQITGFTADKAIPPNAVITGLAIDIGRSSGGTCIGSQSVEAIIAGGVRGRDEAGESDKWVGDRTYGGASDLWGGAIAPTAFDGSFSVRVKTRMYGTKDQCGTNSKDARVDRVVATVRFCVN